MQFKTKVSVYTWSAVVASCDQAPTKRPAMFSYQTGYCVMTENTYTIERVYCIMLLKHLNVIMNPFNRFFNTHIYPGVFPKGK